MGQVWIFLLITILCWGTTPILEKLGLKDLDVFTGLFIRSAAVFFILLIAFIASGKINSLSKVPAKTIVIFSVTGILAGLVGMWTYFKVLKISPSSKIVPLAATYPLVAAILGVYILKEEFSWLRIVGTILIVAGILLVK